MGGEGSIMDMIIRIRNNESLIKRRKRYFEIRKEYLNCCAKKNLSYRKATKEELDAVRHEIKQQQKKEFQKKIFALSLSVIIAAAMFYGAILFTRRYF